MEKSRCFCLDCGSDCPYYIEGYDEVYCRWAALYEHSLNVARETR